MAEEVSKTSKPSFIRRLFKWGVIFGVVIILLLVGVYAIFGNAIMKSVVRSQMEQLLGEPVTIENFSFSLSGNIEAENLALGQKADLVRVGKLSVVLDPSDLFQKSLNITKLSLESVSINEVVNPDGTTNLDNLLKNLMAPSTFDWPVSITSPKITFKTISLRNGGVVISDASASVLERFSMSDPQFTLELNAPQARIEGQDVTKFTGKIKLRSDAIYLEPTSFVWHNYSLESFGRLSAKESTLTIRGLGLTVQTRLDLATDMQLSLDVSGDSSNLLDLLKQFQINVPPACSEVAQLIFTAKAAAFSTDIYAIPIAGNLVVMGRDKTKLLDAQYEYKDRILTLKSLDGGYGERRFSGKGEWNEPAATASFDLTEAATQSHFLVNLKNIYANPEIALDADLRNITDDLLKLIPQYAENAANIKLLTPASAKAKLEVALTDGVLSKLSIAADCLVPLAEVAGNRAQGLELKINSLDASKPKSIVNILFKGKMNDSRIEGDAEIDTETFGANFKLNTTQLSLETLKSPAGPLLENITGKISMRSSGSLPCYDENALTYLFADASILLENVTYQGEKMERAEFRVLAKNGVFTLQEIKGRIFGGNVEAAATFDYNTQKYSGKLLAVNSGIFDLLGAVSSSVPRISGNSNINISKFSGAGLSPKEIFDNFVLEGEVSADNLDYMGLTLAMVKMPLSYSAGHLVVKQAGASVAKVDTKTFAASPYLEPSGQISFDADVKIGKLPENFDFASNFDELLATTVFNLQGKLDAAALPGLRLNKVNLAINSATESRKTIQAKISGKSSEGDCTATVEIDPSAPEMPTTCELHTPAITLDAFRDFAPELKTISGRAKADFSGKASMRDLAKSPADALIKAEADGAISILSLSYLNETAENLNFNFSLRNGLLALKDMQGKCLGGDLALGAELNLNTLALTGKLSAKNTKLFEILGLYEGLPKMKGASSLEVSELFVQGYSVDEIFNSLKLAGTAEVGQFDYEGLVINNLRLPVDFRGKKLEIRGGQGIIVKADYPALKEQGIVPGGTFKIDLASTFDRLPNFKTQTDIDNFIKNIKLNGQISIEKLDTPYLLANDISLDLKTEADGVQRVTTTGKALGGNLNASIFGKLSDPEAKTNFNIRADNISIEDYKGTDYKQELEGLKGKLSLQASGFAPAISSLLTPHEWPYLMGVEGDGQITLHKISHKIGEIENNVIKVTRKGNLITCDQNGNLLGGPVTAHANGNIESGAWTGKLNSQNTRVLELAAQMLPDFPPLKGPISVNIDDFAMNFSYGSKDEFYKSIKLNGTATSEKLDYKGLPLEKVSIPIKCQNGVLDSQNISAQVAGGKVLANLNVQNLGPDQTFKGTVDLSDLSIKELTAPFTPFHKALAGTVTLKSKEFAGTGFEWEKVLDSISAECALNVKEGSISLRNDPELNAFYTAFVDLPKFASAVPNAPLLPNWTKFQMADSFNFSPNQERLFKITKGKADINKLLLIGKDKYNCLISGTVSLSQKLDLKVNLIPNENLKLETEQERILADCIKDAPFSVTGTLTNYKVNYGGYASSIFGKYITKSMGLQNPLDIIKNLPSPDKKPDAGASPSPDKSPSDIFKDIFGGKKPEEKTPAPAPQGTPAPSTTPAPKSPDEILRDIFGGKGKQNEQPKTPTPSPSPTQEKVETRKSK